MGKLFKRLSAAAVATVVAVACGTGASAYTVRGAYQEKTTGGSNGSITLRTEVYTDTYSPPNTGLTVYYYGAKAYIVGSSSIKTKMSLTGAFHTMTTSQEFYKNQNLSESYNSLTESKNTYSSNSYIALTTKTTSNDATFGSCSYNTNGIFY